MSYTELFTFNKKGNAESLGEVGNAYRGAMAVWMEVEKRYLPKFIPEWAKRIGDVNKDYSRTTDFGGNGIQEIWDLYKNPDVTMVDKIALGSTFDKVVVNKEDFPELIKAFKSFEGKTSLKEQAELIEGILDDEDVIAIAWNQTSVNADKWSNFGEYDEETEESSPYNVLEMEDHFNLFEDIKNKEKNE